MEGWDGRVRDAYRQSSQHISQLPTQNLIDDWPFDWGFDWRI